MAPFAPLVAIDNVFSVCAANARHGEVVFCILFSVPPQVFPNVNPTDKEWAAWFANIRYSSWFKMRGFLHLVAAFIGFLRRWGWQVEERGASKGYPS